MSLKYAIAVGRCFAFWEAEWSSAVGGHCPFREYEQSPAASCQLWTVEFPRPEQSPAEGRQFATRRPEQSPPVSSCRQLLGDLSNSGTWTVASCGVTFRIPEPTPEPEQSPAVVQRTFRIPGPERVALNGHSTVLIQMGLYNGPILWAFTIAWPAPRR